MRFKIGMIIKHIYDCHDNDYEIFQIINLDKLDKTASIKILHTFMDYHKIGDSALLVNYPEWEKLSSVSRYRFPIVYCI